MQRGFISHTPYRTPSLRPFIGRDQLFFFEAEGGAQGGAGGSGQGGQGGDANSDRQNLQGLLQRHQGDAMAVIATLLSENHSLRDERRTLRGQLPSQNAVVLSAEQAQQWQAYQQLGAIDAIQTRLQERETFHGELTGLRRGTLIRDAAEAAGYKASVLDKLPGAADLTFEVRETEKDGRREKAAFVKDKDGKETPIADYAKSNWADFLPALQTSQQPAGTTFVQQHAGGTPPASTLDAHMKRFQEQRDAAPNPLAPAAPARSPLA
jgi:hypothetical protein